MLFVHNSNDAGQAVLVGQVTKPKNGPITYVRFYIEDNGPNGGPVGNRDFYTYQQITANDVAATCATISPLERPAQ